MANNKIQMGVVLTLACAYATIASGQGMLVGAIFGVAQIDAVTGEDVPIEVEGVYALTAESTDEAAVGDLAYWDDTNRRITVTSTGNTLVGVFVSAKAAEATTADIRLSGPVTSAASPDIVSSTVVTISSAELLALNATPKELIAAPGAGKAIVPVDAELFLDFNTTAYGGIAAGEDLAFRYTGTAGNQVGTVEATGFLDAIADAHRVQLFNSTTDPVANAPLVLHMLTGEITTGNSPLKVKVRYRVVDLMA
jgi:predicted RecA/RadA family phage recombinase